MKRTTRHTSAVLLSIACVLCMAARQHGITGTMEPHFSPRGGCTEAIVAEIEHARSSIHVQAYSFTSQPIADALVSAKKRGVDVQLIVDKGQTEERSLFDEVAAAHCPTFVDRAHAIAHNKVMVIDGGTVITGSFNFTAAAERSNAENLLVIRSKELAAVYEENWQKHKEHSERVK